MKHLALLLVMAWLIACTPTETPELSSAEEAQLRQKAQELAQRFIIADGHIDLPYRLNDAYEDVSVRTPGGDMDYVRSLEGGLNAPFMSIYTPASFQDTGEAYDHANKMIDIVEGLAEQFPDKFAMAASPAEIREQFGKNLISLPLGMENGAPIMDDLANLTHFYNRGIRYITLAHSRVNLICDSSYDVARKWNGLSPFGREVVDEMNRLGIMIDVSHITDEAFYQVMDQTKVPVIASHSSCRHFTPGFERNMSDDMIKKLAENGGVIMINFGSFFISEPYRQRREAIGARVAAFANENGLDQSDEQVVAMRQKLAEEELGYADIADVVAHFEHVVKLVGVDHVGLGSDYDGVGDSLPTGLKDVSTFPNLIYEFLKLGYSDEDIEKICSGNLFRVWEAVEAHAKATP